MKEFYALFPNERFDETWIIIEEKYQVRFFGESVEAKVFKFGPKFFLSNLGTNALEIHKGAGNWKITGFYKDGKKQGKIKGEGFGDWEGSTFEANYE